MATRPMAAEGTKRREAERAGRLAETLAALVLLAKGYRLLALRHRTPVGEIDIVARRGNLIAFIEVKRRATRAAALAALTPRGRQRIVRAARSFLGEHPALAGLDLRFDAMLIVPGRWPRHLANAWPAEGGP